MTRKELREHVAFRLKLNEWATTQPGCVPPVTAADVETVMAKIRPQLKKAKQTQGQHPDTKAKFNFPAKITVTKNQKQIFNSHNSDLKVVVVKSNPNPERITRARTTSKTKWVK
jgi:hypothetical protein